MELKGRMSRDARKYKNALTIARYPSCKIRKMGRKLFEEDTHSSYIAGVLKLTEEIHKEHKLNPYTTVELLLGDLHLVSVEMFNLFRTKLGGQDLEQMTVEKFFELEDLGAVDA